jgi:exopolyphosphatase/guanosine-5'-triphosphate,3'-diphosphate pyrophosphatase
VEESTETYLLSTRSNASVKIRGGRIDVKHLEAVNDDDLEQWVPVIKAEFPLPAADAASLLDQVGMPAMPLERAAYTLDQLIGEVLSPHSELRAVDVHKRRTRTIAIELVDPVVVIGAVRELGLADRPNTCMARGLKAMAGPA